MNIKTILCCLIGLLIGNCTMQQKHEPLSFEHAELRQEYDDIAPDGSEIRLMTKVNNGSLVHCTLAVEQTSTAVQHKTVDEIWYFVEGEGEVWRKQNNKEEIVNVHPGISLTIPLGTQFQFRNTGSKPLKFVIVTMPPWPGPDEAIAVEGKWQ